MIEAVIHAALLTLRFVARTFGAAPRDTQAQQNDVLLTGTFHSANWIQAHLIPMRDSGCFSRITVVTTSEVEFPEGFEIIVPSGWMRRLLGATGARMATFAALAIARRPSWIGGFHLLFNGLASIILARLLRRRSLYFCVGGPAEFKDGGLLSENRLLGRLRTPSPRIEKVLLSFIEMAGLCVCMGNGAARFLQDRLSVLVMVNPGGVNSVNLDVPKEFDLIFLGRLAPIKNLFELVRAVAVLNREQPTRLVIVGAGELDGPLKEEARRLGVDGMIRFTGLQTDTAAWLARSRVFVLPSLSEGLSLSLMEALSAGLPAVVADVGDLSDLVTHGENGYLLRPADADQIAQAVKLCLDPGNYNRLSANARRSAAGVTLAAAAARWQNKINGGKGICAVSPVE